MVVAVFRVLLVVGKSWLVFCASWLLLAARFAGCLVADQQKFFVWRWTSIP